ncbi:MULTISPECIES: ATP-binding protein [Asticcacaulis]|uniref:ATP-binding protein n=1 Tax=Asticcacaulis TaxID=76890 RepID=UPI001AE8B569|nr:MULTISPECIES: ATP-binding protein [Asticcacaulis]MBP2160202.1 two-component system phosphate regulon sensor histidine kinase PhoR [Asticcacaulis solisilvae]MDR6801247.1 two-component system phosphate regulon sensor histidine kinase PhoR [Asticcacaulis sp. BE141]
MIRRRSLWGIVPFGTWIGLGCVIVMMFVPPLWPVAVGVAALTIIYTLLVFWGQQNDLHDRIDQLKTPEIQVKVQPKGPSFQEVLRAIPDPVLIVSGFEPNDIAGRWIVFANATAQKVFQVESQGGLLVSAIRTPEVLECVDEALFGGISRSTTFETAGGAREQYWRAFASPLPVGDAEQRLALLVMRDETDMRRMEKMRADFLANASHELRTPLASLAGFIETLRGPAKDDEAAREKFLTIMAVQADRMGRLIHDLLSLSRIELNEHVPPSGEADLVLAVKDVVEGLSLIAQKKGVGFRLETPKPGLYPVIGDRDQILQVAQNLIDNALKYAPQGSEVAIEVVFDRTLTQAIAATDPMASKLVLLRPDRNVHEYYAILRVRDAGPGIRREHLPRLAERFYRVEGQKSGDRLGTGLGLAIVKHIINRHRGGLVVESIGTQSAAEDLVMIDADGDNVTPLPGSGLATFTAFTAYFPQSRAFGSAAGLRLVEPLKDAG